MEGLKILLAYFKEHKSGVIVILNCNYHRDRIGGNRFL